MKSLEQIASALQGYDPQALSAQQVADFLRHLAPTADASDVQTCAVADALGVRIYDLPANLELVLKAASTAHTNARTAKQGQV